MVFSLSDIYEQDYREGIGGLLGWSEGALKDDEEDPI